MKKHRKIKKFLRYTFVIIVLVNIFLNSIPDSVFARINEDYGSQTSVALDYNDEFESKSELWKYLGMLVYAIGNAVEWLFSNLLGILSGDYSFPWADRIIFNAIPLLDVNFIAPSAGSLFKNTAGDGTVLNTAVQTVYFTILAIALSFMGIVVAIMAIKIILSSIASEKAKYKESIVNWIFAMVMVFSMHFVLSFVFYINERLVIVASEIFSNAIRDSGLSQQLADVQSASYGEKNDRDAQVDSFVDKNWNTFALAQLTKGDDMLFGNYTEENQIKYANELGIDGNSINIEYYNGGNINYTGDPNIMGAIVAQARYNLGRAANHDVREAMGYLLSNQNYMRGNRVKNSNNTEVDEKGLLSLVGDAWSDIVNTFNNQYANALYHLWQDSWMLAVALDEADVSENDDNLTVCIDKLKSFDLFKKENADEQNALVTVLQDVLNNGKASSNVISEMAEYFKNLSWTQAETGGRYDTPNMIGVCLYAIFVVQSVLFFVAYLKRFFYVVVLSMFAPIIVIYDFFTKSLI